MFEQSGNFHFINLTSRHERGAAVNTALSFYIAIPANTPLWFVVLFHHHYMHGRFTDPKFPGRLPHCRIVVYDVISDRNRPFLDIFLHGSSPENVFYILLHLFPVYANSLSQTKTLPISSSPHGGVSASRFSSRQLPTLPSPHRSRQAVPELPSDARFHPALP